MLVEPRGRDRGTRLHLAVSMRSFRAENVSRFVKAVLDWDRPARGELLAPMRQRYPIALTRDLGAREAMDS